MDIFNDKSEIVGSINFNFEQCESELKRRFEPYFIHLKDELGITSPVGILNTIEINPAFREQGYASASLEQFYSEALKSGCKYGLLSVGVYGEPYKEMVAKNIAYYKRRGWTLLPEDRIHNPAMYRLLPDLSQPGLPMVELKLENPFGGFN